MLNKKTIKSEVINGITVLISKQWMVDASENNCCYKIIRSDENKCGTCYMPGEAEIYFNMVCDEIRGGIPL